MTVRPDQLASTLLERCRAKREGYDRDARRLRALITEWVHERLRAGGLTRAWLIGSLANGTFGAGSDVDIVVEGLDPDREGEAWDSLVERLDCEVDLLRLEDLPGDFAARVEREGVSLP